VQGQRHILVIEDNPGDVRLMREALRDMNPPVSMHVAKDGQEALSFLRRDGQYARVPRPGLIFLDFNIPRSDSREILGSIKADERLRIVPVAVLTSSDSEKDVRDAYQLHANCFLKKPIDLDAFFTLIRAAAHFWLDVARIPAEF